MATCTTTGIKKCSRCTATTAIPATGKHNYAAVTCLSAQKCKTCKTTIGGRGDHKYYDNECLYCSKMCDANTFVNITSTSVSGRTLTVKYQVREKIPGEINVRMELECRSLTDVPSRYYYLANRTPGNYTITYRMDRNPARYSVKTLYTSWTTRELIGTSKDLYLPEKAVTELHTVTKHEANIGKFTMGILGGTIGLVIPSSMPIVAVIGGAAIGVFIDGKIQMLAEGQYIVSTSKWVGDELHVHIEIYRSKGDYKMNDKKNYAPIKVTDMYSSLK